MYISYLNTFLIKLKKVIYFFLLKLHFNQFTVYVHLLVFENKTYTQIDI
jgi:hypothetical protein